MASIEKFGVESDDVHATRELVDFRQRCAAEGFDAVFATTPSTMAVAQRVGSMLVEEPVTQPLDLRSAVQAESVAA